MTVSVGDEDDVEVSIEFEPGWFKAGSRRGHPDNWTQDEGEGSEVHKVKRLDTGEDVTPKISRRTMQHIHTVLDAVSQYEAEREAYEERHVDDDYRD
jgi:hypothetical protein